MKSFVTGSRIYGSPNEKSDVDLVVLTTPAHMHELRGLADVVADQNKLSDGGPESASLVFGKLNLIVVTDEAAFSVWKLGTYILSERHKATNKPVPRDEAIELFAGLRKLLIPPDVVQSENTAESDLFAEA